MHAKSEMASREFPDHPYWPVRDLAIEAHRHGSPLLSDIDLKNLGVEVSSMELESGQSTDGRPCFAKPLSLPRIDELLTRKSAQINWDDYKKAKDYTNLGPDDYPMDSCNFDRAWNTEFMLRHILYEDAHIIEFSDYNYRRYEVSSSR